MNIDVRVKCFWGGCLHEIDIYADGAEDGQYSAIVYGYKGADDPIRIVKIPISDDAIEMLSKNIAKMMDEIYPL